VGTVDSAATVCALVGRAELVHPAASISVMATAARAPSLRTMTIYSTSAGGRYVAGRGSCRRSEPAGQA
jgi:hypothetical protein